MMLFKNNFLIHVILLFVKLEPLVKMTANVKLSDPGRSRFTKEPLKS